MWNRFSFFTRKFDGKHIPVCKTLHDFWDGRVDNASRPMCVRLWSEVPAVHYILYICIYICDDRTEGGKLDACEFNHVWMSRSCYPPALSLQFVQSDEQLLFVARWHDAFAYAVMRQCSLYTVNLLCILLAYPSTRVGWRQRLHLSSGWHQSV